jgi:hypothetical protein
MAAVIPGAFFNIYQFGSDAPLSSVGNCGVGRLVGPGTVAIAEGLSRSFTIGEKVHLKLESTFTDLLNHHNFAPFFHRRHLFDVRVTENAKNGTRQIALPIEFWGRGKPGPCAEPPAFIVKNCKIPESVRLPC